MLGFSMGFSTSDREWFLSTDVTRFFGCFDSSS